MRSVGITVIGQSIKQQSQNVMAELYESDDDAEFHISNGWLKRFQHRHNLTCRSVTSVGQKIPPNAKDLAMSIFEFLEQKYMEQTYDLKFIVGMDESPQWFDLPNSGKYDFRGVKAVKANTTG